VGEDRTENAQSEPQYLTVGEAAKLLGIHRNTIHYRIKTGRIKAHKTVEADREVYRIEADSLGVRRTSAGVYTLDAQRPTAGGELVVALGARLDEIVQLHAQELGEVREQLGVEKGRREQLEEERDRLRAELEALRAEPEPPGSPETATEQADNTQPRSWWGSLWVDAVIAILVVVGLALLIALILAL
jgi:excisionase family DNA binding protein